MGAGIASAGRPVEGWCERAACAIALFTLCSNRLIQQFFPTTAPFKPEAGEHVEPIPQAQWKPTEIPTPVPLPQPRPKI
jgi:hypothetical protein